MGQRPKMAQYVYLSVTTSFFSGLAYYFCYIFYEIEGPEVLNIEETKFFRKFLACPNMGQKKPKTVQFVCWFVRTAFFRIKVLVFVIFCTKLREHQYSKLAELIFLKKKSRCACVEMGQKGPMI